ncbi:hypothetical protein NA78x_001489 [Anatilimnocola sp. NA78]|uniref:hypothetical protein n=1 Tax=Anatilimnocola sp. NA78 TaxID=3415683 RepID=UPI003CE59700
MDQNPYESPQHVDVVEPKPTYLSPWQKKWGGPILVLFGLIGTIATAALRPEICEFASFWAYSIVFSAFGVFIPIGIVVSLFQVGREISDLFG